MNSVLMFRIVSTATYHAMYRVLEAFSLFNTILGKSYEVSAVWVTTRLLTSCTYVVWGFLFFLLALVLRQHLMGHRSMWYCATTAYPWFGKGKGSQSKLPSPITSRSRSRGRSYGEKSGARKPRKADRYSVWAPARAHLATDKYDKYKRGASPRR